jgi:autotransporter-associated beta strand protein
MANALCDRTPASTGKLNPHPHFLKPFMDVRLLLTSLLAPLSSLPSAAALRTWDGGDATGNMTAAANWNGNTVINPAVDQLLFPSGLPVADRTVNNNYAANTQFHWLQFNDSYTLGGTIMELDESLICFHNAGTTVTVNAGISLQNTVSLNTSVGNLVFGAGSQIYLNGNTASFNATNPTASTTVSGLLAGSGQITVLGEGTVRFAGAKTFTAQVSIGNGGTLIADNNGSLGAGAGITGIGDGTLVLDSVAALSIPESLRLSNPAPDTSFIVSKGGAHTLSGPVVIDGTGSKKWDVQGTSLTLSGVISSTASTGILTKDGPGRLTLSGAGSNTADISIFSVKQGELLLNKSGGATAVNDWDLDIGESEAAPASAVLRLGASHQINDIGWVQLYDGGLFDLNGHQETLGFLRMRGSGSVITNGGTLRINGNVETKMINPGGGEATITGALTLGVANSYWNHVTAEDRLVVNGSVTSLMPGGVLTKTGPGRLVLNANVSVPLLEVTGGHLTHTGTSPATNLNCHGFSANLTGTAGDVTISDGSFQIGSLANQTRQTLQCGNLSMGSGCAYLMMTGGAATTDAIRVTGTVSLDQPGLAVPVDVIEPEPVIGEELIIIENDGTDPVAGNFSGYPEGSILTNLPSETFVVSYKGGDGNDVSLTRIITPTGTTRLWDGGGADNNWMTANNWNPNGQPQPGDDLVFPTAAARKANVNNFPAGTTFNSVTVHGTGYTLGGNGITLNEKVEFTSASGNHFLSLPITLALDATISLTGNGFIQATAPIILNGHKLTLHNTGGGTGDLYISGNITGTGKVWKTGPGSVTFFEQPNSYSGPTDILEGTLAVKADATLGATGAANISTVRSGATLLLRNNEGSVHLEETLVLQDGSTVTDNGGAFFNHINGPMQLLSGTATLRTASLATYISSTISGAGGLKKSGSGTVRFWGAQPNTFTGGFFAEEGRVLAAKTNGPAFPGPVTISAPGFYTNLEYEADNQIGDNAAVLVAETGALRPNSFSDTIGSLTLRGGVIPSLSGTLTLQTGLLSVEPYPLGVTLYCNLAFPPGVTGKFTIANGDGLEDADIAFKGVIHGDAVEQSGPGTMVYYDDMPGGSPGALKLKSGIAILHGQCPGLPVTLEGGTLAGKGRVASITTLTSGGLLPGEDPGVFNNTRFMGAGTVTLNAATTCRFKLEGLNPGSAYNQLFPATAMTLGGAALDLSCTFDPAPGDSFMIIRSSTGVPPTGTFAGIPQNGYVSIAGAKVFQVNYAGGDGDDVVLTRVDVTAPEIKEHSVTPGKGDNKGYNEIHIGVKGVPGLTYMLESSSNLGSWTAQGSQSADLLSGLISYDLLMNGNLPRLFFRARLP